MNRKLYTLLLIAFTLILTVGLTTLVTQKNNHNFNFQYIGYLDDVSDNQYSDIVDYYYYPQTGILVIKQASDQILITTEDGYINIAFQNEIDTIKTHVILLNRYEKVRYNDEVILD